MSVSKRVDIKGIALCGLFAGLIALGAFIRVPVPAVPFTLQTLFTNLAGLLLGKKRGTVSVAVYISAGLLGLPVFTAGGGIGYVLYPTFGYLLGFLLGAFLSGLIVERLKLPPFRRAMVAGAAHLAAVYTLGVAYYWLIKTFYAGTGAAFGWMLVHLFLVFIPGDALGCLAGALLYKRLQGILPRQRSVFLKSGNDQ